MKKLQYLYGYLIDKCMYDQVVDLFTEDGEVRFFGGIWKGKEGVRAALYRPLPQAFHPQQQRPDRRIPAGSSADPDDHRYRSRRQDRPAARPQHHAGRAAQVDYKDPSPDTSTRASGGKAASTRTPTRRARMASGASTCSTTSRTGMPISKPAGPTPIPNTSHSPRDCFPEDPAGPDELIDEHWLWPIHKLLPFHMKHPITGEEMVAERWEGDAKRDAERAKGAG